MGPIVLRTVRLNPSHALTGKTRHMLGTQPAPTPSELRIVQYPDDAGYYLFYCDDTGKEFTDTYHDTVDKAMAQAEWEFRVRPAEWQSISTHS
jgi:hypothetical protein